MEKLCSSSSHPLQMFVLGGERAQCGCSRPSSMCWVFWRSLLCLSLSQSPGRVSETSLQHAGQNAFFVLCQHNCNDLACLSTPAMEVRFSWASLSAVRMPILSILEAGGMNAIEPKPASTSVCTMCNSLPSGCGCTRVSAVRRWGLLVGAKVWSPATTSLFFSCPCLCAAVTRSERWAGFKLPILRSEFLKVCFGRVNVKLDRFPHWVHLYCCSNDCAST